jgi:hypothetical protein
VYDEETKGSGARGHDHTVELGVALARPGLDVAQRYPAYHCQPFGTGTGFRFDTPPWIGRSGEQGVDDRDVVVGHLRHGDDVVLSSRQFAKHPGDVLVVAPQVGKGHPHLGAVGLLQGIRGRAGSGPDAGGVEAGQSSGQSGQATSAADERPGQERP